MAKRGNRFKDLTGQTFGRLRVAAEAGRQKEQAGALALQLRLWARDHSQGSHLRTGHTKSCGCLSREIAIERNVAATIHGMSETVEYRTWASMIARCTCESAGNYEKYGGAGVSVCDRWRFGENGKRGFECFFEDMGERPDSMTLDRWPNQSGNYEPGNVRWATITEQNRNRRNTVLVEIGGKKLPLAEWCRLLEEPYRLVDQTHQKWVDT